MKTISRDSWLAIGLFLLLLVLGTIAAVQQLQQQDEGAPLSMFSSAPNGARALRLWLESLDYQVSNAVASDFHIPVEADVALMLEPLTAVTEAEWQAIDAWVDAGGTLVLAGSQFSSLPALRHFEFNVAPVFSSEPARAAQSPLLDNPPLPETLAVAGNLYLQSRRTDFTVHLAVEEGPLLVSFARGQGLVILTTAVFPFSNAGLKEAGNAEPVLNLVTAASEPQLIWFDEWHHGMREQQRNLTGPGAWISRTPVGRALLYSAAVIFIALLLGGRGFGRPVPLARDSSRRGPMAYITAVANLNRRAGHRQAVLQQFHQRLKRDLGVRYRLSPDLADDDFVRQLAQYNPNLDADALRQLLARLRQAKVTENELVQLAAEVAGWTP